MGLHGGRYKFKHPRWHAFCRCGAAELGDPKIAFRRGVAWAPGEAGGGGGGFQKWASAPGPLFCARTDVGAEGAGTQILARKSFFHEKISPPPPLPDPPPPRPRRGGWCLELNCTPPHATPPH